MNILMIYPNKVMVTRAPLGIGYLASYLKDAGHDFKLFDTTFVRCGETPSDDALREKNLQVINPDFEKLGLVEKDIDVFEALKEEIKSFNPGMILISTVDPNHNFGMELLRFCKKHYPEIPTICGGPLSTLVPDDIIVEDCVDIVGRGEAEERLVELVNTYEKYGKDGWDKLYEIGNFWIKDKDYAENGVIHRNIVELPEISQGLAPDLGIFDPRHFLRPLGGRMYNMATVVWTRGCVFRCSYCANETFYKAANANAKTYYRKKDVKPLVEELAAFRDKFNLNFFMFVDDIFPLHEPELMDEFCKLWKEHVNLPFSVNLQPRLVREDTFKLAVEAGMRNICVGVEAGSSRVRRKILKRNYEDEHVERVFKMAHKYKIRCSSFNIIGLPDEEREDILETIALNRKIKPTSATVTFFHPYRGAPLRELCVERGYIDSEQGKHEDVYRSDSQLNMPQITKGELKGLMSSFQLYMKLPAAYNKLIEAQENLDTFEAQMIREKILLPEFKKIQDREHQWDFTKEKEWWVSTPVEEVTPKIDLPATEPGDAGFFPLHDKAKKDHMQELYPGNAAYLETKD
jgi:anaerobic magnesium-protoporphyrin IX monomethyl ester cyclase